MSHAVIWDAIGHRHEVDFGSEPVEISVHVTDQAIEIVVEAPDHRRRDDRRCTLLSLPRHQFASAFRTITPGPAVAGRAGPLRSVENDA